MPDILSQGEGRRRLPGPWPRRAAAVAAVLLVAGVLAWHLPRHHAARPAARAPVAPAPAPVVSASALPGAAVGLAAEPDGILGPALPWPSGLRLPVAGPRPSWFWPATGLITPIAGLPSQRPGYQFTRAVGGWAIQAQAGPGTEPGCGSCAGPQRPVYFLADHARSVTWAGIASAVAPGAAAGTLWLTSYPPGADTLTFPAVAREVGGPRPGPQLRIPPGYVIDQGTSRGLLLAPVAQRPGPAADELWDPAAARASRTFSGVIAASASQVAWAPPCAARCRVQVLNLATGRQASALLPQASAAASAAFSPAGDFLALQLSSSAEDGGLATQLDLMSASTGRLMVVPGTSASSDALVSFGWPASSDTLVAELSFPAKTQLASWHPGAARPALAVIRPGHPPAPVVIGPYSP